MGRSVYFGWKPWAISKGHWTCSQTRGLVEKVTLKGNNNIQLQIFLTSLNSGVLSSQLQTFVHIFAQMHKRRNRWSLNRSAWTVEVMTKDTVYHHNPTAKRLLTLMWEDNCVWRRALLYQPAFIQMPSDRPLATGVLCSKRNLCQVVVRKKQLVGELLWPAYRPQNLRLFP